MAAHQGSTKTDLKHIAELSNLQSHRFDPMGFHYIYQLNLAERAKVDTQRGLARQTNVTTGPVQATPKVAPKPTYSGSVWDALARCESGNTNDPNAPYYGYWQFSAGTWHSLGYTGNADEYPREVQLEAAIRLQARSGWDQWPRCSRRLGLR